MFNTNIIYVCDQAMKCEACKSFLPHCWQKNALFLSPRILPDASCILQWVYFRAVVCIVQAVCWMMSTMRGLRIWHQNFISKDNIAMQKYSHGHVQLIFQYFRHYDNTGPDPTSVVIVRVVCIWATLHMQTTLSREALWVVRDSPMTPGGAGERVSCSRWVGMIIEVWCRESTSRSVDCTLILGELPCCPFSSLLVILVWSLSM